MLRLDLRDYIDVYIAVRVRSVIGNNNDSRGNKKLTFKNNATFG